MAEEAEKSDPSETSTKRRPQFGNRFLEDPKNVFQHNAWDNVRWDEEQQALAEKAVEENSCSKLSESQQEEYDANAHKYWDDFYGIHQNRFFKDRHWLFTEFPELAPNATLESASTVKENVVLPYPGCLATKRILEIGCGAGNTVFPILEANADPSTFVYCCDFSSVAVDLVKAHESYDETRCLAFQCDVAADVWDVPFPPASLDIVVLVFVFSAIQPDKMQFVVWQIYRHLKPGGVVLLRDYGRYDMAQLRFKKGRCLSDNFYARGDGTRVYFFTQDELTSLFVDEGFSQETNIVDRRLQVNRGKQIKMYRVWIQAKFKKS